MLVFDAALLILLAFYGMYMFRAHRVQPFRASGIAVVAADQDYVCAVENVSKERNVEKEYLNVSGWAVEKGAASKASDTIKVVLKNASSGSSLCLPTVRKPRNDITKQFYDGTDYGRSGFEVNVPLGEEIDPEIQDYEIYIYLKNGTGERLIDTKTKVSEVLIDNSADEWGTR